MRSPRSLTARGALAAAAALAAGTVVLAPHAGAANPSGHDNPAAGPDMAKAARTLAAGLGSRTAGSYVNAAGRLVVTVTDDSAMSAVRAAGAVPRRVTRSASTLAGATTTLDRLARVSGTAWAVDPAANQVVVSVDPSVTGSRLARVRAAVRRLGGAARVEYLSQRFAPTASGGDAITTGRVRCSLGFNVKRNGQSFFLTAGHCGGPGTRWSDSDGTFLGVTRAANFPGDDFSIIQYADESANSDQQGSVRLADGSTQDITEAADPVVGQTVQRTGSTSGVHSGQVTAVDATVNYPEGTVTGLIRTTVCAEPGDSGGALFAGSTALGLTSGGSGDCTNGGETFFQPVTEPLQAFGAQVY